MKSKPIGIDSTKMIFLRLLLGRVLGWRLGGKTSILCA